MRKSRKLQTALTCYLCYLCIDFSRFLHTRAARSDANNCSNNREKNAVFLSRQKQAEQCCFEVCEGRLLNSQHKTQKRKTRAWSSAKSRTILNLIEQLMHSEGSKRAQAKAEKWLETEHNKSELLKVKKKPASTSSWRWKHFFLFFGLRNSILSKEKKMRLMNPFSHRHRVSCDVCCEDFEDLLVSRFN